VVSENTYCRNYRAKNTEYETTTVQIAIQLPGDGFGRVGKIDCLKHSLVKSLIMLTHHSIDGNGKFAYYEFIQSKVDSIYLGSYNQLQV
jgi:hypothetical protein